jgi:hypothetical protein
MNDIKSEPNSLRQWIRWIMLGLVAWGVLLGTGAYLYGGKYALLKAVIIAVCAIVFVEFWWLMLLSRERRLNRLASKPDK